MKKSIVLLFVFALLVGVIGAASAEEPACKGLCHAWLKCDSDSPQKYVLQAKIAERGCKDYCTQHYYESMNCDGLLTAIYAVGGDSPACPVLQTLFKENSCFAALPKCIPQ